MWFLLLFLCPVAALGLCITPAFGCCAGEKGPGGRGGQAATAGLHITIQQCSPIPGSQQLQAGG